MKVKGLFLAAVLCCCVSMSRLLQIRSVDGRRVDYLPFDVYILLSFRDYGKQWVLLSLKTCQFSFIDLCGCLYFVQKKVVIVLTSVFSFLFAARGGELQKGPPDQPRGIWLPDPWIPNRPQPGSPSRPPKTPAEWVKTETNHTNGLFLQPFLWKQLDTLFKPLKIFKWYYFLINHKLKFFGFFFVAEKKFHKASHFLSFLRLRNYP